MRPQTMAAALTACKTALDNCIKSGNTDWEVRWRYRLDALVDLIPSGSGLDSGPRKLYDLEISPDAIQFAVSFHHMSDVGYYDGWTDHTVTVRPAFDGITVKVSGRDRNDVKDYIHDTMYHAFMAHVTWDDAAARWVVGDEPCPTT